MDDQRTYRPVVIGNVARAEACPCGGAMVLTLGPVSLRLDRAAASDVIATLEQMLGLLARGPVDLSAPPREN
ncbi:MAG TPA: hypothetical protein VMT03_23080 [Polyangia bacterium]|nr:hypothetical protein [Polyangia bacterium]